MPTLLILLIGLSLVIGGIVFLRLHAFLALVIAALFVALLTPTDNLFESGLAGECGFVRSVEGRTVEVQQGKGFGVGDTVYFATRLGAGDDTASIVVDRDRPEQYSAVATGKVVSLKPTTVELVARSQIPSPGATVATKQHVMAAEKLAESPFVSRATTAIGSYFGKLAILIVCASVIGRCLLDSGAADRIVRSTLSFVGERLAPVGLVLSGFLLSIPVFFDTVFYLMIPLAKSLRVRIGGNYLLYVLSIVAGGTMAHSLVPPTPGPLAVAELLDVPIVDMILGGSVVALVAAAIGSVWAVVMNRKFTLEPPAEEVQQLSHDAERPDSELPPLWLSVLPILMPVALISLSTIVGKGNVIIATLSDKSIALLLSAGLALFIYVRNQKPSREQMSEALSHAVGSAGTILLVTCAGGAFGRALNQTNVASLLRDLPEASPVLLVVAAFFVTTAVRTAQGSATVAMMTAAGIFGPLVAGGASGVAPLYVALAIGCGSKPVAWMNDSGFWVITRMSGMSETEGLKFVSPMTAMMGLAGLLTVIAGVVLFP